MKKIFKLIRNLLLIILILITAFISYVCFSGYNLYKNATAKMTIQNKIEEIKSEQSYISLDNIPKTFQQAIISVEDRRFYLHKGLDPISFTRALVTNYKNKELVSGGSTITQQLAKNMYFSQEKKFQRKIAEVLVAFDLEQQYKKDEILELYLNIIYFGDGYYGIESASKGYFKKTPEKLSLYEQTLLAGIPNAPSVYALTNDNNLAIQRQKVVIEAMYSNDYISKEDYDNLLSENETQLNSKK